MFTEFNSSDANLCALEALLENVRRYDQETNSTIRLIPTEGMMSPLQKLMYESIQNERYLHAPPENTEKAIRYPDIKRLQITYDTCRSLGQKLFGARYFIPDFLSGMHVQSICLMAFSEPGDVVLSIDPRHGGHEATSANLHKLGRKSMYLPFDCGSHRVAHDRLDRGISPRLIYLDHSNSLFANNTAAIKEVYPDAILIVDLSQVMAIVAAGLLPNPLQNKADIIVGSTHKSLNGPQKALAATNDAVLFSTLKSYCSTFISSNHMASIGALAVCLFEFIEFGRYFSKQLVANANHIGRHLLKQGIPVYLCADQDKDARRLTETQHIWVDCQSMGWDAEAAVRALYEAGIVVNTLFLCNGGPDRAGAKGLRLGTTEVTRLGMARAEMQKIADFIGLILKKELLPNVAAPQIAVLRQQFRSVKFCYQVSGLVREKSEGAHLESFQSR